VDQPNARAAGRSEDGGSAVEYGLLAAGIAGVIATAVFLFGGQVSDLFDNSCNTISSTASSHGTSMSC
jgi:pilus assembly protein Flp/PilA